jgi:RNA polymerase subunit RPABC4/transcription elongation factor Spt4/uncharacterized membrane protein
MKCINCGNELEENAKFCPACGTAVVEAEPPKENIEPEKPSEEKPVEEKPVDKCKNCGAALEDGAKFCPACGATTVPQVVVCQNCGTKIEPGIKFCPSCGTPAPLGTNPSSAPGTGPAPFAPLPNIGPQQQGASAKQTFEKISKTPDTTSEYETDDIELFKRISIVAYLGLLVLIPILCFPKSRFTRFHSNQGLILLIVEAIFYLIFGAINLLVAAIGGVFGIILMILVGLITLAGSVVVIYLIVTGIINAAKGRARELPLLGKFRILKY